MAINNDVFAIMPVQNDDAILGVGATKDTLAVNQVGIFDYDTGLSIDVAGAATTRNFYVAMAVDRSGDGFVDDYVMSAGSHVQKRNMRAYSTRCYTPGQNQVIDIANFKADCDTQYALKVEINNDEKYMNYGFNQLAKTFVVKTSCCDGCEGCPSGDCIELVTLMLAEINADEDGFILASAIANTGSVTVTAAATTTANLTVTIGTDVFTVPVVALDTVSAVATKIAALVTAHASYTATATLGVVNIALTNGTFLAAPITIVYDPLTTGTTATVVDIDTVAIADLAVFGAANPGVCPTIRLTGQPAKLNAYCDINTKYYHLRNTAMTVSFIQGNHTSLGFTCNGTIVSVQDLVYPEGEGYDVANIEYKAGGFTGDPSPYRVGTELGLAFGGFSNLVGKTTKYNKIDLTYDLESNSGWLDYKNNLNTSIVIPCGNDAAAASIAAVLDALMVDFDPKANDLAACVSCVAVNKTTDKAANVDGIG